MESFTITFEFDAWPSCTMELWLESEWVLLMIGVSGKLKFVLGGGNVEGDGNSTGNERIKNIFCNLKEWNTNSYIVR